MAFLGVRCGVVAGLICRRIAKIERHVSLVTPMPNVWTLKFYTKQIIYIHTQYTQSTTIIGVNNVQWFYFCSMETIVEALFFQCIFFILVLKKWLTVFFFSVFVQRFFFLLCLDTGNASSALSLATLLLRLLRLWQRFSRLLCGVNFVYFSS